MYPGQRAKPVWPGALGYQPALTLLLPSPHLPHVEEEAGLNLHHEARIARSLMGVSA